MTIEAISGVIALSTTMIGLLPQSYKAFKTGSTDDVSMLMIINCLICSMAWAIYGICISSIFVWLSNAFCVLSNIILIIQKIHYDSLATTS